jgi:hypothetical protein
LLVLGGSFGALFGPVLHHFFPAIAISPLASGVPYSVFGAVAIALILASTSFSI